MTFDPNKERLGDRTGSIQEWKDFKKSTIWLDLQDYIEAEIESRYDKLDDDSTNMRDYRIGREIIKFLKNFLTAPDQYIEDIEIEKESKEKEEIKDATDAINILNNVTTNEE